MSMDTYWTPVSKCRWVSKVSMDTGVDVSNWGFQKPGLHFSAPATWDELGSWQQLPQFGVDTSCNLVCRVEVATATARD